jgi:hypothetical protein
MTSDLAHQQSSGFSDDELVVLVARMLTFDDVVPQDAVRTAELLGELGSVDAELANLTFDSLTEAAALVVRADESGRRVVVFETGSVRIDVELVAGVDDEQVIGQIEPVGAGASVVAEGVHEQRSTTCDARGRFRMPLPPGMVRFRVDTGSAEVVTPWLSR